jgi:hypothetical protein
LVGRTADLELVAAGAFVEIEVVTDGLVLADSLMQVLKFR